MVLRCKWYRIKNVTKFQILLYIYIYIYNNKENPKKLKIYGPKANTTTMIAFFIVPKAPRGLV